MMPISSTAPPSATLAWAALQSTAVTCDLSPLSVLAITGADAEAFLQGQLSNDVKALSARGAWQRTTYNSPKGRVLATFLLWQDTGGYRAIIPQAVAESVRKRLAMYVLRAKVTLADVSPEYALSGLAGPGASAVLTTQCGDAPGVQQVLAVNSARILGLAGGRFILLSSLAGSSEKIIQTSALRATPASFAIWQWLAIRAGEPMITAATQDQFVLQALNLDVLGAASFGKGCYSGQEIIARMQYLGRLKERLFGWHCNTESAAPGTRLYSRMFDDQACGMVIAAAPGPEGGIDLLATVQIAAVEAGDVHLESLHGKKLAPLPLPYSVPQPSAPPRRLA